MTDFDPEHLRSIAEVANDDGWEVYPLGQKKSRVDFLETFDPPTVLALLDALAAQQKVVEAAEKVTEVFAIEYPSVKKLRDALDALKAQDGT